MNRRNNRNSTRTTRKNQRIKKIKKFSSKMQANLLLVFCIVIIALLGIIGRLLYINSNVGDVYAKRVLAQQTYTSSSLPYKRGAIYDSQGTVLAFSDKAYNLIIDIKFMRGKDGENVEPTIKAISDCYDFISKEELAKLVEEKPNHQYVILAKELSYDQKVKFEEYIEKEKEISEDGKSKVKGVWFEEMYIRKYPNDTLASSIVGFTTKDGKGNWGIEQYYNDYLSGTDGISYGYIDNELNLQSKVHPPTNGNSLVTTINGYVQRIVQDHIKSFNEEYGSKNIGVIVMNPNNGEIIAMASNEEYDLNNPADLTPFFDEETLNGMTNDEKLDYLNSIWRNFIISDSYEPGSTFKPFTIAAALEEGLISENQTFYCDGGEHIGGWNIRCHKRSGHGTITLTEALAESCNDALMQIAESLGRYQFYDYHTFFGFGQKTGIDLPGEASGLILSEEKLNESELATSSFGQTFTTTMLQMVAGYSSVINGGNYYEPHFVKQILNDDGHVIEDFEPEVIKKTVSKKTSDFLNSALYATVEEGTAKTAKVPGYQLAGKTGTAQKQPRSARTYVVSFIGHVPALDPEVVIYVIVDEPQNVERQANSAIATGLASEILGEILPFLEIYPDEDLLDDEDLVETGGDSNNSGQSNSDNGSGQVDNDIGSEQTDDNSDSESIDDNSDSEQSNGSEEAGDSHDNTENEGEATDENEYNPDFIPDTEEDETNQEDSQASGD
jgi:stage V sporulation protein D (sporulation-specific penicillin-binding protein)